MRKRIPFLMWEARRNSLQVALRGLRGSDSQDTVMEWINGLGLNMGE